MPHINKYTLTSATTLSKSESFTLGNAFEGVVSISVNGLNAALYRCTGLTGNVSFPKLKSVDTYGLYYAFNL